MSLETFRSRLKACLGWKPFCLDIDHSAAHLLLCANLGYINSSIIIIQLWQCWDVFLSGGRGVRTMRRCTWRRNLAVSWRSTEYVSACRRASALDCSASTVLERRRRSRCWPETFSRPAGTPPSTDTGQISAKGTRCFIITGPYTKFEVPRPSPSEDMTDFRSRLWPAWWPWPVMGSLVTHVVGFLHTNSKRQLKTFPFGS